MNNTDCVCTGTYISMLATVYIERDTHVGRFIVILRFYFIGYSQKPLSLGYLILGETFW